MPSDYLTGPVMLRITALADGCWHLVEAELGHTIATFTTQGDAFDYARDLLERGKHVIILVDGNAPAFAHVH
jgi:hypothetical protein